MIERNERSHWKEEKGVEKIRDNENVAFHNHRREDGEKKGSLQYSLILNGSKEKF